jgi:propionyl-CoA carboxylase beta chain
VVTGYGTINGRLVFVFSQDFTVFGGALRNPCREDLQGDGPGHEGRRAGDRPERLGRRAHPGRRGLLGGYADVFQKNVMASGVVPQISMIMGPCAGGGGCARP